MGNFFFNASRETVSKIMTAYLKKKREKLSGEIRSFRKFQLKDMARCSHTEEAAGVMRARLFILLIPQSSRFK